MNDGPFNRDRPFVTSQHVVRGGPCDVRCPKCRGHRTDENFFQGEMYYVCRSCGHRWEPPHAP